VRNFQRIEFISGLCPLLGGEAVFKARTLFAFYNNTLEYDDHSLCSGQGIEYRKAAPAEQENITESRLNVYPNPTNGLLNVSMTGDWEGTFEVKIFSITGQLLLLKNNVLPKSGIDLKAGGLSNGIYVIECTHKPSSQTFRTRFVYGN